MNPDQHLADTFFGGFIIQPTSLLLADRLVIASAFDASSTKLVSAPVRLDSSTFPPALIPDGTNLRLGTSADPWAGVTTRLLAAQASARLLVPPYVPVFASDPRTTPALVEAIEWGSFVALLTAASPVWVSSVDGSGGSTGLSLTGGPITTVGTLTLGGTLGIGSGGTAATTPAAARVNLGTHDASNLTVGTVAPPRLGSGAPSSATFLRGDNVWATPATGAGSVTSVDGSGGGTGLSLTGGPITTTGTLTLGGTLGIGSGGTGATTPAAARVNLGTHDASNLTVGTVAPPRLGTGAAGVSTFLRGDNVWATPPINVGTVTSVDGSGGSTGLTLTGGAITSAGTLVLGGILAVTSGGTGASSPAAARSNLGAGTVTSVDGSGGTTGLSLSGGAITGSGTLTLGGTLAIGSGGTGATTPAAARVNLGTNDASNLTAGTVAPPRLGSGPASSSTFLRGDSVWASLPAPNPGTVTSVSGSGGSTGLSLTGGPITSSGTLTLGGTLEIESGGTGATTKAAARVNLGTNDASNLTTGTVAPARLGSGSPSSSTFLRGDSTWAAVTGGGGGALTMVAHVVLHMTETEANQVFSTANGKLVIDSQSGVVSGANMQRSGSSVFLDVTMGSSSSLGAEAILMSAWAYNPAGAIPQACVRIHPYSTKFSSSVLTLTFEIPTTAFPAQQFAIYIVNH